VRIDPNRRNKQIHTVHTIHMYASPNFVRMIKLRKIIRSGHVTRMGEMINAYKILVGKTCLEETTR